MMWKHAFKWWFQELRLSWGWHPDQQFDESWYEAYQLAFRAGYKAGYREGEAVWCDSPR